MALFDRAVAMAVGVLGQGATSAQFVGPATIDAHACRIKDTQDGGVYEYFESGLAGNVVGRIQRVGSDGLSASGPLWLPAT